MAKLLPRSLDPSRQTIIYAFFLLSWFALILFYRFKRDAYYINRHSLKWGSIIGLCIPVVNGLVSGNWLWKTLGNHQHASALVDVLWILLGVIGLWILKKLKKKSIQNSNAYLEEEAQQRGIQFTAKTIIKTTKKMRTKLSLLWLFLAIGFIFHHIYGLASVFFNETVFIEGSTGETPMWAHGYRIAFEGIALLFAIFTLQTEKTWFIKLTFVWSIIIGLFNIYHVITAIIYEATNLSEILILVWMVIVSIVLFIDLKALVYPKK